MAGTVSLQVDARDIRRMLRRGDREVRRGAANILTRTARSVRARSIRGTSGALRIPQKIIKRRFYVRRATARRLRSTVHSYVRPVNPGAHPGDLNAGLSNVQFYGHSFPNAFVIHPSGRTIVAKRKPAAAVSTGVDRKGRPRRGRLPVKAQKIEVRSVAEPIIATVVKRRAQQMISKDLPREILFRLSRSARR